MYSLPYHKEKDEQVIKEFTAKYPFAFLSGCDKDNNPVATQLPVFLEETEGKKILRGHLMKNTDHHKAFVHNPNVLVVFTGPNIYVSGSWYSNPHTPSTWNYMSVHAKGIIRFLNDQALVDALRFISLHFEDYNTESPTIYDHLPQERIRQLMKMIAVFEIEVTSLDTVFKLSQDRDKESYLNIIAKLRDKGESGRLIADEMEKRTSQVFPK